MRIVTVNIPNEIFEGLNELVRQQRYPNRSEAIRVAIRDLLKDELWRRTGNPTTEEILAPVWETFEVNAK